MAWAYEGHEGYVHVRRERHHTPIYRLWKEPHHVYTSQRGEYNRLARNGYKKDGVAAFVSPKRIPDHIALHQLSHPRTGDTLLTVNRDEVKRKTKPRSGYVDLGVIGYVAKEMLPGHQPLYRAYDPIRKDHLHTHEVETIDEFGPTRSRDELRDMVREALRPCLWPYTYRIELNDEAYYCPSTTVARSLVLESKVVRRKYIRETFDCDDFAHLLKGAFIDDVYDSGKRSIPYAMGIVWGNSPPHAMNFVVLSDGASYEVKLIEPQGGKFLKPLKKVLRDIYLIVA